MKYATTRSLHLAHLPVACLLATYVLAACQVVLPAPPLAAPAAAEPLDPELG